MKKIQKTVDKSSHFMYSKEVRVARQLSWLEHAVHTRSVEGSNPPLATQEGSCKIIGFTTFFLYNRGRGLYEKYGFEKMSHEMELLNYPLAHEKT